MTGRLEPPPYFDDERRGIWQETVDRLTSGGRIFKADPEVLITYCEAVRSHRQASRLLAQTSVLITRDGHAAENPALAVQRRTAADLARASRALGLNRTPMTAVLAGDPMTPAPPGRWCDRHSRHECVHDRNRGGDCHATPVRGLDVCKNHGGKPLAVLKADGQARRARLYSAPLDIDPAAALLEVVQWTAGDVAGLRAQVQGLAREQGPDGEPGSGLWWGLAKETFRDGEVAEREFRPGPHSILKEYNAGTDRLIRAAAAAVSAGAQQEAVDVARALGSSLGRLLDAIFDRLLTVPDGMDGEGAAALAVWQRAQLPVVVPQVLREFDPQPGTGSP